MSRAAYSRARRPAKSRSATSCGKSRNILRSISPIVLAFKENFTAKTALELALRTNASVSMCEKVLDGRAALGGEFLENLMASDFGGIALMVIASGSRAPWARDYLRQVDLCNLRGEHAAAARRLAALESGEGA